MWHLSQCPLYIPFSILWSSHYVPACKYIYALLVRKVLGEPVKIVCTVGCNFGTSMTIEDPKVPWSAVQHQSQVRKPIFMVRYIRSAGVLRTHRENVNVCVLGEIELNGFIMILIFQKIQMCLNLHTDSPSLHT